MAENIDNSQFVLYEGQKYRIEKFADFDEWLRGLRDVVGRKRIADRIRRMADGNFGDAKPVGDGVQELRLHFGPGYRVYFILQGEVIIVLLTGGGKDSQSRDIAKAKLLARELYDGVEDDTL